jgi:hypothetical protein
MNPLIGCSVAGKQEYIDYRVFTHPGPNPDVQASVIVRRFYQTAIDYFERVTP